MGPWCGPLPPCELSLYRDVIDISLLKVDYRSRLTYAMSMQRNNVNRERGRGGVGVGVGVGVGGGRCRAQTPFTCGCAYFMSHGRPISRIFPDRNNRDSSNICLCFI